MKVIPQALMRPGRLDRILYVPLPDENTRKQIINIKLGKMPVEKSVDVDDIVRRTNGYSGAEVKI
jgi:AAA family ATPase